MSSISPRIPLDYTSLKDAMRNGLKNSPSREYWWPYLPAINSGDYIENYPDIAGNANRLRDSISEPALDQSFYKHIDDNSLEYAEIVSKEIVKVLNRQHQIEVMSFFYPSLRILIAVLRRADICYKLSCDLLNNREKFLDPSFLGNYSTLQAFRELLKINFPKTYTVLNGFGALDDKYLNMMFVDCFSEILPGGIVLQLFDAFLLEGVKVLYRYGLALIKGYKDQLKSRAYSTARDFWIAVKADATFAAGTKQSFMLHKLLGGREALPALDAFLVYSNANNKEFLESGALFDFAFDTDRSVIDKVRKPMKVTTAMIRDLRKAARDSKKGTPFESSLQSEVRLEKPDAVTGKRLERKSSITEMMIERKYPGPPPTSNPGGGGVSNFSQRRQSLRMSISREAVAQSLYGAFPEVSPSSQTNSQGGSVSGGDIGGSGSGVAAGSSSFSAHSGIAHLAELSSAESSDEEDDDDHPVRVPNGRKNSSRPLPPQPPGSSPTGSGQGGGSLGSRTPPAENAQSLAVRRFLATSGVLRNVFDIHTLLSFLPTDAVVEGMELVFSTRRDGWDLQTMYAKTEGLSPCLIVLQLVPPIDNIIVGAYLSTGNGLPLSPPSEAVKGDSRSFVFRLDEPHAAKYRWKGNAAEKDVPALSEKTRRGSNTAAVVALAAESETAARCSENGSSYGGTTSTEADSGDGTDNNSGGTTNEDPMSHMSAEMAAAVRQIVLAMPTCLTVGASHELGTHAIRLDSDMRILFTGPTDTFGNPPLVGEEEVSEDVPHLEVREVEVYCGATAVMGAIADGRMF